VHSPEKGKVMDFETFQKKRNEYVEWMTANGFNEGDCEKNGEFKVLHTLTDHYDLFIDVGANNGIFIDQINAFALRVESSPVFVLAFEPNPKLKEILVEKIVHGTLIQSALSNQKGHATFKIYTADDTTSSLFDRTDMMPHFTKEVTHVEVSLDMLDSYLPLIERESSKGVFLKIDAEGVELPVLEGARDFLTSFPVILLMFEYSKAWKIGSHALKAAFHLLDNFGFKIFRVTPLGLESLRFYTPDMEGPEYCNYFAVKGFNLGDVLDNTPVRSATHNWNDFYLLP
jgi:FkbM family methyltransferase